MINGPRTAAQQRRHAAVHMRPPRRSNAHEEQALRVSARRLQRVAGGVQVAEVV